MYRSNAETYVSGSSRFPPVVRSVLSGCSQCSGLHSSGIPFWGLGGLIFYLYVVGWHVAYTPYTLRETAGLPGSVGNLDISDGSVMG